MLCFMQLAVTVNTQAIIYNMKTIQITVTLDNGEVKQLYFKCNGLPDHLIDKKIKELVNNYVGVKSYTY